MSISESVGRLIFALAMPFLAAWWCQVIYMHFATRFNWPGLSYWETWCSLILIGSIGTAFFPSNYSIRKDKDVQ